MDAPTPTAAGLRHRAATRRRARFGLLAFTAASVAFNVSVILQLPDYTMQRLALAALAPITQAYMGHLLAGYLQSDMLPSGTTEKVNKWTRWAVVAIALGAFALSFQTLYAAAKPDHGKWAFIFPLTLDLAIAVCTWMLVVIARADERDQAAGVQPHPGWWSRRAIQRNPSTVQAEAVAPLRMGQLHHDPAVHPDARTVERPAPATDTRTTELVEQSPHRPEAHEIRIAPPAMPTVHAPDVVRPTEPVVQLTQTVPQPVHHESAVHPEPVSTWDDVDTEPVVVQTAERPMVQVEQVPREPVERPVEQVEQMPGESVVQSRGALRVVRPEPVVQPHRDAVEQRTRAEMVHQRGGFTYTVDEVERVLTLTDDGMSQRKIADATGIGSSTVGRMQKVAAELDESVPVA